MPLRSAANLGFCKLNSCFSHLMHQCWKKHLFQTADIIQQDAAESLQDHGNLILMHLWILPCRVSACFSLLRTRFFFGKSRHTLAPWKI